MRHLRARVGRSAGGWIIAVVAACACARVVAAGDEPLMLREGFEGPRVAWSREQTDTTITLQLHDRTDRAAHDGRTSERFRFTAGLGSAFYFSYALPRVPVAPDLRASLFVRGNRAGVQIFARVVLPADVDPETKQPSYVLISGTIYESADRWQRLELVDFPEAVERQARVLRASTKRPIKLEGAFVDQVVVNLFAGTGEMEVFLDELAVGPVAADVLAAFEADRKAPAVAPMPELAEGDEPGEARPEGRGPDLARVRMDRNRLKRRAEEGIYRDWFFTAIHAPGADLASLRNAGFDVLMEDLNADPRRFREAIERDFLLMPMLGRGPEGAVRDADAAAASLAAFPLRDHVAAWHLGDRLGLASDPRARKEELERVRALIGATRSLAPGVSRLTTGRVDDDFALYARAPRGLDLIGARPPSWASSVNPLDTYSYLKQRRDLVIRSNAGACFWAMLPASAPPPVGTSVWGYDVPPAWGNPTIQSEQLRTMTYAALMAGYRGVAYRADGELTRPSGRMLLLEMAMLNAEIDLFESILANGADPIPVYSAHLPDPPVLPSPGGGRAQRAPRNKELPPIPAMFGAGVGTRDRRGVLLLVGDFAQGGQYQPPQMARNDVSLTVIVPESAQAFDVTPGRVRVLDTMRDVGGTRITIPEFDTTALILITTDLAMAERVEEVVNRIRPRAVQMAIEQAELKLQWVTDTNGRLAADGHYLIDDRERRKREANGGSMPTDQADLLGKSAENIKAARENLEREDFAAAWDESRRASRPLRILMRGLWDNAYLAMVQANMRPEDVANEELIKVGRARRVGPPLIVPPVASAPLASFNMLPQHYLWVDWMREATWGRNLVPSGSFDDPDALIKTGWADESYQYEGVASKVATVPLAEGSGRRRLKMTVEPAVAGTIDRLPPFLDYPVAAIRTPPVSVRAGQFLRVSMSVQRAIGSAAGAGGLVVRDSIGGEALQFVNNAPIAAPTRLVLYRRAPADGEFTVTLGLAGYGDAYFDDFAVERVEGPAAAADVAELPRPTIPSATPPATARGGAPAAGVRNR